MSRSRRTVRRPRERAERGLSHAGERFEAEVGPVAHGGHCVVRHDGRVVFVRHALPGERVVVEVTEGRDGDRFWRGDAVSVLSVSPDRVEAPCPYAGPGLCGGCDFQHVSPAGQRGLKTAVVREQLSRLAGLDLDVEVEEVPPLLRWRTRMRYVALPDGRRGLHVHRSDEVVEIEDCLIDASGDPSRRSGDLPRPSSDLPRPSGDLPRRSSGVETTETVRTSYGTGDLPRPSGGLSRPSGDLSRPSGDLSRPSGDLPRPSGDLSRPSGDLPRPSGDLPRRSSDLPRPSGDLPRPSGDLPRRSSDLPRRSGDLARPSGGVETTETVRASYGTRDFAVAPDGFWQSHVEAPRVLVETVLGMLRPEPGERVLDLYAGVGLFAAFLADAVGPSGRVVAVEGSRIACRDARANLPPSVRVEHGPVDRVLASSYDEPFDLVLLDPPREGARREVVEQVADRAPRAVAYVACDPAALARDLATFGSLGYAVRDFRAFDLFPMTFHAECVAHLVKW